VASARQAARGRVHTAKAELNAQAESSKQEIERSVDALAAEILKAVLPAGLASGAASATEGIR
jgi:hypothetical protein